MTPTFKAKVSKGLLFFNDTVSFRNFLLKFKEDTQVTVTVKRIEDTISDSDRKYYWAVVAQMIADEVGHSKDTVHEAMKIKFASYVDETIGMTMVESVFSNESTWQIHLKKRFIRNVRAWASDFLNLDIPEKQAVDYD